MTTATTTKTERVTLEHCDRPMVWTGSIRWWERDGREVELTHTGYVCAAQACGTTAEVTVRRLP
jgi:hypothetical protein